MATSQPSSPIQSSNSSACYSVPDSPQGPSQFPSYNYLLESIYPTSVSGPSTEMDNIYSAGNSGHLNFLDHVTSLPCTSGHSNEAGLPGLLRPFAVDDLKTKVKVKAKSTKPRKTYVRNPKPPYTYCGLTAAAILMSPDQKLTIGEIRNALIEMFPFFSGEYQGWRDSVRHCLSRHDCFYREFYTDRINKWRVDVTEIPHDAFTRRDVGGADYKYKFHLHDELGIDAFRLYGTIPTHPLVKAGIVCARMKDADDFLDGNQPDDTGADLKHGISAILERTPVSVIADSPFSMETARSEESHDVAPTDKTLEYGPCRTIATSSSPAETVQRDMHATLPSTSAVTTGYGYHDNETGITSENAGNYDMAQTSLTATSGTSAFYPGYPTCNMLGQYESSHYPASHGDYLQYYPNYQTAYVNPENYPYFQNSPHYPSNFMYQHFDGVPDVAYGNGYGQHYYPYGYPVYGHPVYSYPDHSESDSTAVDLCNRKSSLS